MAIDNAYEDAAIRRLRNQPATPVVTDPNKLVPTITIGGAPAGYQPQSVVNAQKLAADMAAAEEKALADEKKALEEDAITQAANDALLAAGKNQQFPPAGTFAGYDISGTMKRARFNDGNGGFYYGAWESISVPVPTTTPTVTSTTSSSLLSADEQKRQDTMAVLADRFAKYGLTSLVTKIKQLAIEGASESTITLQLQETPEYKERFKANSERVKKNLQVLTPSEYLSIEDSYRQALRAYGLNQFDNDAYVSQFIANDMSPTELSNRIVTAVQRVKNADPAITTQLRQYYGIGQNDLVAYVLDPAQQFQKIERQVAAAEIGVVAGRQGLEAGVSVAEQLAAQGITQAEAQKGYATIADILPTSEKLSQIYGTTMDTYGQSEAEQEVFNQLASAQRKREKLSAREIAAFSASSGVNKSSLTTPSRAGQI